MKAESEHENERKEEEMKRDLGGRQRKGERRGVRGSGTGTDRKTKPALCKIMATQQTAKPLDRSTIYPPAPDGS